MFEPSIVNRARREIKKRKTRVTLEMCQSGLLNCGAGKVDRFQVGENFEATIQVDVHDRRRAGKTHMSYRRHEVNAEETPQMPLPETAYTLARM